MAEVALGIVVNPKLRVPCLVTTLGTYVNIVAMTPDFDEIGSGYYGLDDEIAVATGLPRSHTPDGVTIEGEGYGTSLYTALCLGAHQNTESHEGIPARFRIASHGPDGDGICSTTSDRSEYADDWWERARRKGLARAVQEEQEEEDVDVTSDFDGLIEGQEYGDGIVSHVSTITAVVSKTLDGDVYLYDSAERHKLVVADFTIDMSDPASLWRVVADSGFRFEKRVQTSLELILALDVRGLDVSAMNLLGILAERSGATETELHDFRFRWESGLDPSMPVKQIRLPFAKNSSEARRAREALAHAAELRDKTGWSELESLP